MTKQIKDLHEVMDEIEQNELDVPELDFETEDMLPWSQWEFLSLAQKLELKAQYPEELKDFPIE